MQRLDANSNHASAADTVARATLLNMTPRKWCLVRTFEAAARLFLAPMMTQQTIRLSDQASVRILVVEYWNLGDLAILVPFLRSLRRNFPGARISLLLKAGLESFLEGQGLADEFIPVQVPWARHFHRWRKYNPFSLDWISLARTILAVLKRQFDWAFSGRMDVRDNFLLWLTGARRRIAYGIAGGSSFLTDQITPNLSRPHRADLWLQLLKAVCISPTPEPGGFRLTSTDAAFAQAFLSERGIPRNAFLVGIHAGARITTRRWGDGRFAEVTRRLLKETDAHILWFSEPGASIQAPELERCHSVSLDFRRFLAVLSRCRLLVCNDSGPMHLANLLSVPVVAIFGPQRPEWFGPKGPHDRVVIRSEFSCRPCFDYCIYDQPYCLRAISPDEVHASVQSQMNEIRQSDSTDIRHVDSSEPIYVA